MVAGGMESMSNVPFLVGRDPPKYGGHTMEVGCCGTKTANVVIDHLLLDGVARVFIFNVT